MELSGVLVLYSFLSSEEWSFLGVAPLTLSDDHDWSANDDESEKACLEVLE